MSTTPTFAETAQHVQAKVDKKRADGTDSEESAKDRLWVSPELKARIGRGKTVIDYTLINMLKAQNATHAPPAAPAPLPATPPRLGGDSGFHDAIGTTEEGGDEDDALQVHLTYEDSIFSPKGDKNSKNGGQSPPPRYI